MSEELNKPAETATIETPTTAPVPEAKVDTSASASTSPAVSTKAEIVAEVRRLREEREAAEAKATTPNQTPAVIDTPVGETAATAGAAPTVDSKFDEDTVAMANAYGVDISGFTDDVSARNAVKMIAARYAAEYVPETVEEVAEEETVEEIDRANLDAKTAAYVKKLEAEAAASRQQLEQAQQYSQRAEQQKIHDLWAESTKRAVSLVDKLAHPSLGVTGKTTPLQNAAREAVFKTAGRLLSGFLREGRDAPAIEVIMRSALELTGIPVKGEPTKNAKSLPPGPTPAAVAKKVNLSTVRRPHDPLGIMQDEDFRRGVQEIFAARS